MPESKYEKYISGLPKNAPNKTATKTSRPSHVFYGGADRFSKETPEKLGKIAIASMEKNSGSFADFAKAMWLPGAESLPDSEEHVQGLEFKIADDPETARQENRHAWLAWEVHRRVIDRLNERPIEEYRIDFEDGYGFRADEVEDADCIKAAQELAALADHEVRNHCPKDRF